MIYYIYEVPGEKNGATHQWEKRRNYNFNKYQIEPIIVETLEGPDTEDMWKVVGDREYELADLNGYKRGDHYLTIRVKASKGGQANASLGNLDRIRTIENLSKGGTTTFNSVHWHSICAAGGRVGGKKSRSLTFKIAEEIRSKWDRSQYGLGAKLAKEYGVSANVISQIVNNKTYITP